MNLSHLKQCRSSTETLNPQQRRSWHCLKQIQEATLKGSALNINKDIFVD